MKARMLIALALCVLCAGAALGAVSFTAQPAMNYNASSGQWQITFALSETTDVEVAVVDMADSTIVRRLAAGMLGSNPPAPLAANALSQTLTWDGKNDLGQPVAPGGDYSVRVRAGMGVSLNAMVGNNPYFFSQATGASVGPDGSVYIHGFYGAWGMHAAVRKYDPGRRLGHQPDV
jgi:hypothetical protein